GAVLDARGAPERQPASVHWGLAPAVFPAGARMAVVSGDPTRAGLFTVQLAMPSGYKIPPHFHPTDESVEVKKGTLLVGMGDKFDAAKAKAMKAGDKGSIPAKAHHFAAAQGATFIQVTAMGPFALTYVNPADDPRSRSPSLDRGLTRGTMGASLTGRPLCVPTSFCSSLRRCSQRAGRRPDRCATQEVAHRLSGSTLAVRDLAVRRHGPILRNNSDALNPEAQCRAVRPCLGGSESRNRLSGTPTWPGFAFLVSGCSQRRTLPMASVLI